MAAIQALTFDLWDTIVDDDSDEPVNDLEAIPQFNVVTSSWPSLRKVTADHLVATLRQTGYRLALSAKLLEIDESIEKKQVERLGKLKQERNNEEVRQVLDKVRQMSGSKQNIMPVLIEAVKTYATVGEITDAMRDVFGDYREPSLV